MTTEAFIYPEIDGYEIEIPVLIEVTYVDLSFDHAFGTERGHDYEVELHSYELAGRDGDGREYAFADTPGFAAYAEELAAAEIEKHRDRYIERCAEAQADLFDDVD